MKKFLITLLVLSLILLPACNQGEEVSNPQTVIWTTFHFSRYQGPEDYDATVFVHANILQVYDGIFGEGYSSFDCEYDMDKPYIVMKCEVIHNFFSKYQRWKYRNTWMTEGEEFLCWVYNDDPLRDMEAIAEFYRQLDSVILYGVTNRAVFNTYDPKEEEVITELIKQDKQLPMECIPLEWDQTRYKIDSSIQVIMSSSDIVPIQDGCFVLGDYVETLQYTYTYTDFDGNLVEEKGGVPIYFLSDSLIGWGAEGMTTEELYKRATDIAKKAVKGKAIYP